MKEVKRYSGVIVKCGDEVLLCKRNATGSLPGQWSIPCGHLEEGEHPIDGIKREFKEETNYTLDNDLKLVGFVKRKILAYISQTKKEKKLIMID